MSQFEEIPPPGRGFQGSRALGGLAACKTLASTSKSSLTKRLHHSIEQQQRSLTSWFVRSAARTSAGVIAGRLAQGELAGRAAQ
jgi:hypothetical protein